MSKFQPGGQYRHISTLDIDLVPSKVFGIDERGTSFHTHYWNRHGKFFHTDSKGEVINELVFVASKDFWKWKEVQV